MISFQLNPFACQVKMSLSCYQLANQLSYDVLLIIFDQLEEQDFLRFETVCRQWRNVFLSGTPWRRLFHRKIVSSPYWRNVLRIFGVDVDKLETVHYRSLCRAIIEELKHIDQNWQTGNFKKTCVTTLLETISNATIWDNCIVLYSQNKSSGVNEMTFGFFHQKNLEVTSSIEIPNGSFAVTNTEIVVGWDTKNIKILDTNGQLISEVPELNEDERVSWNLEFCCLSKDQMAVLSKTYEQQKLSVWDVSDPLRATRLQIQRLILGLPFSYWFNTSMKMDYQFIAISTFRNETTSFYFFSKKTLDLHWQKTVDGYMIYNFAYGKGLLLLYVTKENDKREKFVVIEVYDVTSRTCVREMSTGAMCRGEKFEQNVGFNSKVLVVVENTIDFSPRCKINIYDLEAIKNPNSSADELLVCTQALDFRCQKIAVTETEILYLAWNTITILDFSSIHVFRNATNSVVLSLPWRSVWRRKGVDEEPLEPARHMEAYRKVLKYFDELSMNIFIGYSRKAIETDPVFYLGEASFTLGFDFINDKQLVLVTCVEEMNDKSQDMNDKPVQINGNVDGSVMEKAIQLIDVTTGDLINEMKLNIDAIGFHIGGNLLVSVSKMAEYEHLLSVWRVENSLNLTHIKDLTIGKYIPDACDDSLQLDEQFIAVHVPSKHTDMTYYFLSLKTCEFQRSLTCYYETSYYDGGYLFLMNSEGLVRILDVASGTFLHDIRMELSSFEYIIARVNSNYVVIAIINKGFTTLYVYDLKCLKETDVAPTHLLLTTIELRRNVKRMAMNETRIVCLSYGLLHVIDLKHVDRLRCPESC